MRHPSQLLERTFMRRDQCPGDPLAVTGAAMNKAVDPLTP
jgi:hypothetical protein